MPPKPKPPAAKAGAAKKKKAVYGKGPELPAGEIITDQRKRRWKLGKAFASGGFGQIYTATSVDGIGEQVVIKMEPAANGPLFQEMHVYQRILKPESIAEWKRKKGVKFLGIPQYLGSGKHEKNGVSHRFLVMPAFGKDLEHYREEEPKMSPSIVSSLAVNIINALEYLHDEHYVHADVKAENLLLEHAKSKDISRMFLVDFGLAKKVADTPIYKEDPRKAHDGTLIFTSLDAHRGCPPSYRGDLEILAYNVFYWLCGDLPWIKSQSSPEKVFSAKTEFSKSVEKTLKKFLAPTESSNFLTPLTKFFDYIYNLDYATRPDYVCLRKWMLDAGKKPSNRVASNSSASSSRRSASASPKKTLRGQKKTGTVPEFPARSRSSRSKRPSSSAFSSAEESDATEGQDESSEESPSPRKSRAKKAKVLSSAIEKPKKTKDKPVKKKRMVPLKPSRKLNHSHSSHSKNSFEQESEGSDNEDDEDDVIPPTPSPDRSRVGGRNASRNIDLLSPAVRKQVGSRIIPGLAKPGEIDPQKTKAGSKVIPGLANFKRRKSIEASLVKKYLHKPGPDTKSPRSKPSSVKKVSMVDTDSQTSPFLWYGSKKRTS